MRLSAVLFLFLSASGAAQTCSDTPAWSPCELNFELTEAESRAHPEPWRSVDLRAEVKSPRYRTFLAEAYWNGGRQFQIRFTPTEPGAWSFKLTSNIPRLDNQSGAMNALTSEAPGYLQRANVHHWRTMGNLKPHLWMGADLWNWENASEESIAAFKARKISHVRTLFSPHWPPDPAKFQAFEKTLRQWNADNLVADVVLAGPNNEFTRVLKDWPTRERYLRYLLSRLAPLNVTWELARDWESYRDPRALFKDLAALIQKYDPYSHPRSAYPQGSTAAFARDGWMSHVLVNGDEPAVVALEHQLLGLPVISVGRSNDRKRLLNAVFSGSYLGFQGNEALAKILESTRYWELEPYFDVSNGRALALDGTEYLVYVEKPGIVEIEVEKHGYDVAWINPETGERLPQKEFKSEHFIGETPTKDRDWILHLSREGRKQGMLTSYKFESRPILAQEPEVDPKRIPFTFSIPDNADLKAGTPIPFELKIVKDSRATRFMLYYLSADVPTEPQGQRLLSTAEKGTLVLPSALASKFPAVLNLRVAAMNANGKVYLLDRVVRLTK